MGDIVVGAAVVGDKVVGAVVGAVVRDEVVGNKVIEATVVEEGFGVSTVATGGGDGDVIAEALPDFPLLALPDLVPFDDFPSFGVNRR